MFNRFFYQLCDYFHLFYMFYFVRCTIPCLIMVYIRLFNLTLISCLYGLILHYTLIDFLGHSICGLYWPSQKCPLSLNSQNCWPTFCMDLDTYTLNHCYFLTWFIPTLAIIIIQKVFYYQFHLFPPYTVISPYTLINFAWSFHPILLFRSIPLFGM